MILKKIAKKLGMVGASLVLMMAQMTPFFVFGGQASADGDDSPAECLTTTANVTGSIENNGDLVSYSVGTGKLVEGVCIKSGNDAFGDKKHSELITSDGLYGNGCYTVVGIGTQTVTVTRIISDECKDISHIDVVEKNVSVVPGSITIEKNAIPDSDQAFRFTTTGLSTDSSGFQLVDDSTSGLPRQVFNDLPSGQYTISEIGESGWVLDGLTCSAGSSVVKDETSVTITLSAGENVACTFTNREKVIPVVDYCDPSQRPSGVSIGQWLADNGVDGSDCFEYEVTERCGYFDVSFTKNLTPYTYSFRYALGDTTPDVGSWEGNGSLPVSFSEDENDGLVELTYYVVGPESDYFEGFGIPNIWDANGVPVSVDTDCEEPAPSTIRVIKYVDNDNGGTVTADQFGVSLNNEPLTVAAVGPGTNFGSIANFEPVLIDAGIFEITEDTVAGYEKGPISCYVNGDFVGYPYQTLPGEVVVCNVFNYDKPATIFASKIVCDNESLLPNWGTGNGENITSLTAIDWVANPKNEGCELAEGWNFEYAFNNQANPGDNIEEGGAGWIPFGPTNSDGVTSVEIEEPEEVSRVWIREQLKNGYLGFTYNENNETNVDSISAELYCNEDVLNYDNFDYISNPQYGAEYYCVAWNVKEAVIRVHKEVVHNENGTKDAEDFEFKINGEDRQNFAEEGEYVELSVKNGEYTIEEVPVEGYSATYDGCENIVAVAGSSYDCYIKNEADKTPPKVYVTKYTCEQTQVYNLLRVIAEYCDDNTAFNFEIYNNEQKYAGFSLSNGGTYDTGDGLEAGSVEVVELEKDRWSLISSNCYYYDEMEYNERSYIDSIYDSKIPVGTEFTAENGVTYYCEFYNEKDDEEEEEFGEIVVTKFNDLNNNGAWDEDEPTLEGWEINVEGVGSEATNEDGTATFNGLTFDNYVVTETMQDGWEQTVNSCVVSEIGLTVDSVETVECYIGNYKTPSSSTPGVLGTSTTVTPPAVLATTGSSQSSYMFATGLTLIAATLLSATNRKKVTVSAK